MRQRVRRMYKNEVYYDIEQKVFVQYLGIEGDFRNFEILTGPLAPIEYYDAKEHDSEYIRVKGNDLMLILFGLEDE